MAEWFIATVIGCLFGVLLVNLSCFIDDVVWRIRNDRIK